MYGFERTTKIFLTSFSTVTLWSHYPYKGNKTIVCSSWFLRASPSGNRPGPRPGRGGAARWWRCWSGRGLRRCICGPPHRAERRPAPDTACTHKRTSVACKTCCLSSGWKASSCPNRMCTWQRDHQDNFYRHISHTHTPFTYPTYPIILCINTGEVAMWGLISMTSHRIFHFLHPTISSLNVCILETSWSAAGFEMHLKPFSMCSKDEFNTLFFEISWFVL